MVESIEDVMSGRSHFVFVRIFSLACLVVDMQAVTILLMGYLETDLARHHSVSPNAVVSVPYHSYGKPNPDIPA